MQRVTTIILPCAGLAKRLRPLTNRIPKALVRLDGKPLLAYMLREAEASGIMEAVLVVNAWHKRQFKNYLREKAKDFPGIKKIRLRIQHAPLGDGHAVLQAADCFGRGPVAVRFADDLIMDKVPVLIPLIAWHLRMQAPVLLLERVPRALVTRYGIVETASTLAPIPGAPEGTAYRLKSFVEKPSIHEAPSRLAAMGGYILTPSFLSNLRRLDKRLVPKHHDALRLADVFRDMLLRGERVYGYEFSGKKLDCGTIEGLERAKRFLRTTHFSHI